MRRRTACLVVLAAANVTCGNPTLPPFMVRDGGDGSGGGGARPGSGGVIGSGGGGMRGSGGAIAGTGGMDAPGSGGVGSGGSGGGGMGGSGGAAGSGGAGTGGRGTGGAGTGGAGTGGAGTGGRGIGGAGTGGAGTGGAGTGGAGTGGAGTGGAGTGGAGTGGAMPPFTGGPCVASADLDTVEVFGRGTDSRVYRRTALGTTWATWAQVSGLDAAVLDARSDLDCAANATTVHVVATGTTPLGAFMHGIGFGTVFNPFVRELASSTFGPGPAITTLGGANNYRIAAVDNGLATVVEVASGGGTTTLSPITSSTNQFVRGPDLAWEPSSSAELTYFAAFDASASLAIYRYVISASPPTWNPPVLVPPPTGMSYTLTPGICAENPAVMGRRSLHIVAVAGGRLWHAVSTSAPPSFGAWEQIAPGAASSPDCTVMRDSTTHVVALTAAGTIIDVRGSTGSWTSTDLGGH